MSHTRDGPRNEVICANANQLLCYSFRDVTPRSLAGVRSLQPGINSTRSLIEFPIHTRGEETLGIKKGISISYIYQAPSSFRGTHPP